MENVTDLSDQRIRNILSKIERNRKCSKKVLLSCFKTLFEELFGMLLYQWKLNKVFKSLNKEIILKWEIKTRLNFNDMKYFRYGQNM